MFTVSFKSGLTYDFVLSVRQVIAHHAAYVRPETVADAMYVERGRAGIGEMGVELSRALGHQPGVAQRRQVTRKERQRLPIHREHVIVFSVQVRWFTRHKQTTRLKIDENKIVFYFRTALVRINRFITSRWCTWYLANNKSLG